MTRIKNKTVMDQMNAEPAEKVLSELEAKYAEPKTKASRRAFVAHYGAGSSTADYALWMAWQVAWEQGAAWQRRQNCSASLGQSTSV